MKALSAACLAALCCAAPHTLLARGKNWRTAVDLGTILSANGIVPTPGQGYSPWWGGSSADTGLVAQTAIDAQGNLHAVANGTDLNAVYGALNAGIVNAQTDPFVGTSYHDWSVVGWVGYPAGPQAANFYYSQSLGSWSARDLNPPGYTASLIQGTDGDGEGVGWALDSGGKYHAWFFGEGEGGGTELLPPAGFKGAGAAAWLGDATGDIVGYGTAANGATHPLLWLSGNTDWEVFDMLPAGATTGLVVASDPYPPTNLPLQCGGSALTTADPNNWHAAVWTVNDTNGQSTMTDVHPVSGYRASSIYSMRAASFGEMFEVGLATKIRARASLAHAIVWSGTAASATDLNGRMPAGFTQSVATGVDRYGNIYGAALMNGVWHSVYWPLE